MSTPNHATGLSPKRAAVTFTHARPDALALTFLAAVAGVAVLYVVLPAGSIASMFAFLLVNLATIACVTFRLAHASRRGRRMWLWLAAAQAVYLGAYIVWYAYPILWRTSLPFPSVADALFLTTYVLELLALIATIRSKGRAASRAALLDASILGVGVGVLAWMFLIGPDLRLGNLETLPTLVAISYPLFDCALLVLALRLALGPLRGTAHLFILGWIACQLGSDTAYSLALDYGHFVLGGPIHLGWLLSFGMLGAAALHPSAADLEKPAEARTSTNPRRRLLLLLAAGCVAPAAEVLANVSKPADYYLAPIAAMSAVSFLLVALRLSDATVDIGKYESLVDELEHSRQRFRQMLEGLPVGVFVMSNDGAARYANRAAIDLLGRTPLPHVRIEGLAEAYSAVLAGTDEPYPTERMPLVKALRGHHATADDMEVVRSDRRVPLEMVASPVLDHAGRVVSAIAVLQDISERRQIETERLRHAAELARSNSELEQFAYVASHDLQEPLRMITSYCQLLQQRYAERLDADAQEFIGYAVDGAARMQALIQGLLAYARIGSRGKPMQPLDLAEPVRNACRNLEVLIAETQADVSHSTMPWVLGDEVQLTLLFQNLISNAIKFRGKDPPIVSIDAERCGDTVQISVADNGIGIEAQFLDRIFVIFQRLHTSAEYPGTGIGLAVCKKIVERHGGRVWAESEPGRGSRFVFALPATQEEKGGT